jgi:hypothetical protein
MSPTNLAAHRFRKETLYSFLILWTAGFSQVVVELASTNLKSDPVQKEILTLLLSYLVASGVYYLRIVTKMEHVRGNRLWISRGYVWHLIFIRARRSGLF